MRRSIPSIVIAIVLLLPGIAHAQSGDATWLNTMDGLETGIGRSWMAPLDFESVSTITEYNAEGTPTSEISWRDEPASTPVLNDQMQTQLLSALIFEYDSEENAAEGVELFHEAQLDQISRDPRNPATNAFAPGDLGSIAYGNEGTYEFADVDGNTNEMAVVYLLVQQDSLVYQVFGQFLPGQHVELATGVAEAMITAEAGSNAPVYDMNGESTGGLWEKLNAIEISMPEGSQIADLEVFPPDDDAVMGDSVVMPQIDLDNLASVPGIIGSWHITFAPAESGVLISTPNVRPADVFNIELWVMEFEDPTSATAAAISLNGTLTEPLGIVGTEGGGFGSGEHEGITLVNSGFVRDRSLPEGDAAVVVTVEGSTLYAARVYSNGPAPTPLAHELIDSLIESNTNNADKWSVFPQSGDDMLHGLEPVIVRHEDPTGPVSTPVG